MLVDHVKQVQGKILYSKKLGKILNLVTKLNLTNLNLTHANLIHSIFKSHSVDNNNRQSRLITLPFAHCTWDSERGEGNGERIFNANLQVLMLLVLWSC